LRNIFRERGFFVIDSRLFFFGITELLVVQKNCRVPPCCSKQRAGDS
jgi:hypothetical protein